MPEPVNRQEDFSAGMYRGREAPWNAVYDAVNCLIDDEGQLFRRGGCGTYVASAGLRPQSLMVADMAPGRVAIWTLGGGTGLLKGSVNGGAAFTVDGSASFPAVSGRFPQFGDLLVYRRIQGTNWLRYYGGSQKASTYSTGTNSVTHGDRTMTGVGTAWLANVDAGMLLGGTDYIGVVESVESDTSLTLREPWPGVTSAGAYSLQPVITWPAPMLLRPSGPMTVASRRLLVAVGRRLYFSDIDKPFLFQTDNYHELPYPILGLETLGGTLGGDAFAFTDRGAFVIRNLLFDPEDDAGNIQHEVAQVNALRLWQPHGLLQWQGALVVPCRDDIYVMAADGSAQPVTGTDQFEKIRPLWRSYVRTAGYTLGNAAVFDGTYLLPVIDGGDNVVSVLVCRLDRGAAWTRWTGEGAGRSFAVAQSSVYAGGTGAVRDATSCWAPGAGNAIDADGSTHAVDIIGRDFRTPGPGRGATTTKLRARYDGVAVVTPAVTASFARGLEAASFTALPLVKGGADSDGLDYSVWRVAKQAPAIRFRLQSSSAFSSFTLRSIEAPYTRHGLA